MEWKYDTDDAHGRIYGTPLIADGRVYVANGTQSFETDSLVALDQEDGVLRWSTAEQAFEVPGTPALDDDKLYLVDFDNRGFTVDARAGDTLHIDDEEISQPPPGVSPLVQDGTVFTTPFWLEARDGETWSLQWSLEGDSVRYPPAIDDGVVVAACEDCTEIQDGEKIFIGQKDGKPMYVSPISPSIRAIDAKTGTVYWKYALPGLARSPVIADGAVYVTTSGNEPLGDVFIDGTDHNPVPDEEPTEYREFGTAHALDIDTGAEYWSTHVDSPFRTMPAVYRDTICAETSRGIIVALDAATGDHHWETRITGEEEILSRPTIGGDTIYLGSRAGCLYALDRHDGSILWQFETESSVTSNLAIFEGTIYFGDDDGNVYRIGSQ